jgi:hypothetical protein
MTVNIKLNQPIENEMEPGDDGHPGDVEAGQLRQHRQAGEELLAAGDAIINRALSGNSQAFLLANRQQGGQ